MKKIVGIAIMLSSIAAHAGLARVTYHYALAPSGRVVVATSKVVAKTPSVVAKAGKKAAKTAVKVAY